LLLPPVLLQLLHVILPVDLKVLHQAQGGRLLAAELLLPLPRLITI
jgi:hypothetical protein